MFTRLKQKIADEPSDGSKQKPTKSHTVTDNQETLSTDDNGSKKRSSMGLPAALSPSSKSPNSSSSNASGKFSFPDIHKEIQEPSNAKDDTMQELESQTENIRKSYKSLSKTKETPESSVSRRKDATRDISRDTVAATKSKLPDYSQHKSGNASSQEKGSTEATTQLSQGSREELKKLKQQIGSLQDKNKELEQICEKERNVAKDKSLKLERLETEFEAIKVKEANKKAELYELQNWQREEITQLKQMLLKCQDSQLKAENGVKETTERLDKASADCEAKTREIKDLRACIEEITADRDEFMRRDKETKRNLIELQHLSDSYKDQVESLTKEVSSLRSSHANVEEIGMIERKRLQQEIVSKNSTVMDLEEKVKILQQRLETAQLPDNDEKLQAVMKERDALEKQIEDLKQEFYQTNSKSDELVNTLTAALNRTKAELMQSEATASSSISRLTKDIEDYKLNSQKQQEVDEAMISNLKEKVEALQTKLEAGEEVLRKTDSCNTVKTSALQEKLTETEQKFRNLDKVSTEKITGLQQQINEIDALLSKERLTAEQNLTTWKSFCDEKDIDIENQKQLIDAMQNENVSFQEEGSKLKQEIDRLKELLNESKEKMNELEGTITKKNQKISILKNANDAKEGLRTSEIETLKSKIADLDRYVGEQAAQNKELEIKLEEIIIEKEVLSKGNDERETAISLLRQELAERDQQLSQKVQTADGDGSVNMAIKAKDELHVATLAVESKPFADQFSSKSDDNSTVEFVSFESFEQDKLPMQDVEALMRTNRDLQEQLDERNRTIKMQQQRLRDLKKELHGALKSSSRLNVEDNDPFSPDSRTASSDNLSLHNNENPSAKAKPAPSLLESGSQHNLEINFEYLKNVIYKFMSSSDSEAQHLVKVIATLLKFTPTEIRTIKRMMDYKMSWFRPKPSPSLHQASLNSSRI